MGFISGEKVLISKYQQYRDECGEHWRALGCGGANYIGNTLGLLAERHALRTFEIHVMREDFFGDFDVLEGLFGRGYDGRLVQNLKLCQRIGSLSLSDTPPCRPVC